MRDRDPDDAPRGGRWSLFAAGLVAGLILGLSLSPGGVGAALHGVFEASGVSTPTAAAFVPPRPIAHPAPPPPRAPIPARLAAKPGVLTVGVFGDSLGDGLYTGLYRDLQGDPRFQVLRFTQVSTGLSRYDYVDVQANTAAQTAARHIDVAVIFFGANDQQGIVQGRAVFPFASPGWRAAYAQRVDDLARLLKVQGAAVYWVGLPRMQRAHFDQGARVIDSVYAERAAADGVRFIPSVGLSSGSDGAYSAYLPDSGGGRPKLMRASDGIHMSMAGYLRIAAPVAATIKADLGAPVQHAGPPPPSQAPGMGG